MPDNATSASVGPRDQTKLIKLVAKSLRSGAVESQVNEKLQHLGFSQEHAAATIQLISHALRSGISAAITGGRSKSGYERGKLPLYDAAFDYGVKEFQWEVRRVWITRGLLLFLALAATTVLVVLALKTI